MEINDVEKKVNKSIALKAMCQGAKTVF